MMVKYNMLYVGLTNMMRYDKIKVTLNSRVYVVTTHHSHYS